VTEAAPDRPIENSYWVERDRLLAGEYPIGTLPQSSASRLEVLLDAGFGSFVDLTEAGEDQVYEVLLGELASARGMSYQYFRRPIPDFGIPTRESMIGILDTMDATLAAGRRLYLHCLGGVGRTGTAVGCYLVRHGMTGSRALRQIETFWMDVPKRLYHPRSPETGAQLQFVLNWNVGD
jgi:hypothetical protein